MRESPGAAMRLAAGALLLALAAAQTPQNVTVVRQLLALEQLHTIIVDFNTEYIMDFIPTEEQRQWPTRVWVSSDGGDTSRPVLITHRQMEGAGTWQVPVLTDGRLLFHFERTLCPHDSIPDADSECAGEAELRPAGWFSLHAVSACARPLRVQLRATPARDWRLQPDWPLTTHIDPATPRVHYYMFPEGQDSVRLVIESEDDVCATIAIQDYTCPIAETLEAISLATVRMTVQRSGGVQLSRSRYPRGFYIVSVAHDDDAACAGEDSEPSDWLWEAAVFGAPTPAPAAARRKTITITTRPALSVEQYALAAGVTLLVFALFYAAFGALVLAQRWPRFFRLVRPRAILLQRKGVENGIESQADASQTTAIETGRRRRGSDATFDSSDMSDTESSEEESPPRQPAAARTAPGDPNASAGDPGSPAGGPGSPVGARDPSAPAVVPVVSVAGLGAPQEVASARVVSETDGPNAGVQQSPDTETTTADQGGSRPFGLPARLHVAALARRKERVLRARSDRYLTTLATVAVFYALPVVQFVVAFQIVMNVSGSLDLCYYNFLCAHPAGMLADFNHVYSNLGYLLLGALFMLQLRRRRLNRDDQPKEAEYGIPAHYGLLMSLGAGMMVVALLSASYHVCPNSLNFQFDVAFMYVLAVLSMVKIYQSRHPDVNARAHATFGVLAVLIAIVVWGVLGGGALFWGVFTVLHVFTFLLLSLRIYYIGQFRLEKETLARAARGLRRLPERGVRPLYTARLVMLLIANAVNWAFALYGLATQSTNFASHLLFVLLSNTLVYMLFYLCMKLLHGERPRWYAWCYLVGAAAAWGPALYYFTTGSSSWSSTPAQSRHRNHECRVLQFYDAHDLWHFLSAIALYLTFNTMLTWDDGLSAVPRSEIAVF